MKNLESGEAFTWNADRVMPTASPIKFPLMISAYRQVDAGILSLGERIMLAQEDKVPGSGVLPPHLTAGATLILRDAIQLMIAF